MLGIERLKIGVAGLNPHCSENNLCVVEESSKLIPTVYEAKGEGLMYRGQNNWIVC